MDAVRILIVEDDLSFAHLVQHQLEMLGYDTQSVLIVSSLSEAQEAKIAFDAEVVLLDLGIADSNGIQTYDAINELYKFASIIILSGLNDMQVAQEIVARGAQDYLLKTELNIQLIDKTIRYGMLRRSFRLSIFNSEKMYRDVFNRSPLPVIRLMGDSLEIVMANPAALALYQAENQTIIGKPFCDFNYYQDQRIDMDVLKTHTKKRVHQKTMSGSIIITEIVINKLEHEEGAYIALIIDRTEELKFEKQKFDVIAQAEEREKKKIARELHDGLGQQLTLVNLLLQNLSPTPDQETAYLDVSNLLKASIRDLREIAYELNPPELEHGFISAIERLTNRVNSIGKLSFDLKVQQGIDEASFAHVDRINLFRIIQELINNTLKHAQATKIICSIEKSATHLTITISDNGIGFDPETAKHGMGMQNIQYRMKMCEINYEYYSEKGKGVKFVMKLNFS